MGIPVEARIINGPVLDIGKWGIRPVIIPPIYGIGAGCPNFLPPRRKGREEFQPQIHTDKHRFLVSEF
ncbi:MAG: hypothetical protein ABSC89_10490 [Verrucomicrobiota bacterium]